MIHTDTHGSDLSLGYGECMDMHPDTARAHVVPDINQFLLWSVLATGKSPHWTPFHHTRFHHTRG